MAVDGGSAASLGAQGAAMGSVAGPWGTVIGGAVGALAGALGGSKWFGGTYQPDPYAEQLSNLSRDQWTAGANLMAPAENQLLNYAESPTTISNAVTQAQTDNANAVAEGQSERSRSMSNMGLALTPDESTALNKQDSINAGLSQVAAMNQARRGTYENQQTILSGTGS